MSVPMDFTNMDDVSSDESSGESGSEEEEGEEGKPAVTGSIPKRDDDDDDGVPSDVESSDDDDEDVDEEAVKGEIVRLQQFLKESPFHYDSHVALVAAFKKAGDLTSLRAARQSMSELFPLTPSLWLEWIDDERRMEADRGDVDALFRRAVDDYVSVDVWLQWGAFAVGSGDAEAVRAVFERALSVVGLHVVEAPLLWESYREFETATLGVAQPAPGAVASAEQREKIDAQTRRVLKLFERQLGIPHANMNATMAEYEQWVGENDVAVAVKKSFIEAKKRLAEFQTLEDALEEAEEAPQKLEAYKKYIAFELEKKSPARIQLVYERALVDNCLNQELWEEYGAYLDGTLKIASKSLALYRRATRNCPWSGALWQRYMLAAEKAEEPKDTVDGIYEKALGSGFAAPADYGVVSLAYLDYLRRRCVKIERDEKGAALEDDKLRLLRAGFQQALDFFSTIEGASDEIARVARYWARFEAKRCGNMEDARKIWIETIFPLGYNVNYNMQMEFINLESAHGSTKHCRRHFHKALSASQMDYPEAMVEAYVKFEREEGSLDNYSEALAFVEKQKKIIKEREEKRADKEASETQKRKPADKRAFDGGKAKQNGPPTKRKKQEFVKSSDGGGFETVKANKNVDDDGFKVPQLPVSAKINAPKKSEPEPPAKTPPVDEALEKRDRTVFVSNLKFNAGDDDLREAFKFCGPITSIRLVTDTKGKPRGFGYVEFAEAKGAEAALKMDRYLVKERPLYISKVKEKGAKSEKKFQYTTGLEPRKLFVKNLPLVSNKDTVTTMFKVHGNVVDVRLITHKSGKSKGVAYVEFETEEEAKKAMLKTDGMTVGENKIEVAISNTPQRRADDAGEGGVAAPGDGSERKATSTEPPTPAPHLGGGKRETVERGKARTQIAMVPRAAAKMMMPRSLNKGPAKVATPATPAPPAAKTDPPPNESMEVDSGSNGTAEETKTEEKKSNDDFRKMFLK